MCFFINFKPQRVKIHSAHGFTLGGRQKDLSSSSSSNRFPRLMQQHGSDAPVPTCNQSLPPSPPPVPSVSVPATATAGHLTAYWEQIHHIVCVGVKRQWWRRCGNVQSHFVTSAVGTAPWRSMMESASGRGFRGSLCGMRISPADQCSINNFTDSPPLSPRLK